MLRADGFHNGQLWRRAVSRPLLFKFSKIYLFFIPLNVLDFIANSRVCLFVFFITSHAHIYITCFPLGSSSVDVTDVSLSLTSLMLDFIHAVVLDWLYWPAALTTHCTLC